VSDSGTDEHEADAHEGDVPSVLVHAVVVTFNAPDVARANVLALSSQTLLPGRIILVENPSAHDVDVERLQAQTPIPIELIRLPENVGPAGGFAAGLEAASARECDAIWAMDDDILPRPDCLEQLVDRWETTERVAIVAPELVHAATGEDESTWGWCGVLLARDVVRSVGLPRAELFYGFEDQDYLVDRCQLAGYHLVREPRASAVLPHRDPEGLPAWHCYYLPRNATYQNLYRRSHIPLAHRLKRLVAFYVEVVQEMWKHPDGTRQWALFARGVIDGGFGRLGRRVQPEAERRAVSGIETPPCSLPGANGSNDAGSSD
jgi:GT2 family glycosyltransferase